MMKMIPLCNCGMWEVTIRALQIMCSYFETHVQILGQLAPLLQYVSESKSVHMFTFVLIACLASTCNAFATKACRGLGSRNRQLSELRRPPEVDLLPSSVAHSFLLDVCT